MKSTGVALVFLTLLSLPASADPAAGGSAAAQSAPILGSLQLSPLPMFSAGAASTCNASATCWDGTVISCSCNDTVCSCESADASCDSEVGHVACGSTTIFCEAIPDCGGGGGGGDCDSGPRSKCISGLWCQSGCGNCGPGSCVSGTCNCLI